MIDSPFEDQIEAALDAPELLDVEEKKRGGGGLLPETCSMWYESL